MKKNYIIPYGRRFTSIGVKGFGKITLMCVDNIGLEVKHKTDYTPTEDDVRRNLIGWSEHNTAFIQANSLEEALQEFINYPECKTGIKHKAWELLATKDNPVKEYSGCQYMLINDNGYLSCQRYADSDEPDNMVCILDGLSEPPSDCPIDAQLEKRGYRSETIEIGGVWVKKFSKSVVEMQPIINSIKPSKVNL
ncbi:MAG TPA: hypothetical protein VN026_13495 [Bacteroidia bacterium]|jgi:hypothetical protein|nr:hypothetical protein [Bacteroidia bacterium]